jgi:hypothetical protein
MDERLVIQGPLMAEAQSVRSHPRPVSPWLQQEFQLLTFKKRKIVIKSMSGGDFQVCPYVSGEGSAEPFSVFLKNSAFSLNGP